MKDRPEPFLTLSKQTLGAPYHKLFSSITDVVCVFDEQGIFRYISPVAVQLFGYKPEEMIGCSFLNFIHPDDAARSTQDFKSKAVPGEKMYFENCFVRKNGTAVSVIWSRRWDPTERLFYCIARDGSEKYETEQRLLKAQQMAGVANYEFDLIRNCYLYTSDTMFEIFGIDKQKHPVFTFGLFWNSLHPEDRPAVKKDILIDERSKRSTLEYRIIRPGGEVVYVSSIREIICGADGTPLKTIGTIQDITDRKNSELAVKQSEERFRCLVQNSNDLIGIVDADGVYRFVGENVQRHLGYKPEELTGMNCLSFIHPEDAHWVASALQNAATKNVLTIGPYRFRSGEDKWRWIETIVSNQLQNPAIQGLIINSRDVTEKTYKEEERRRYKERIREQSRTMVEVLEQMRDGFLTITMEGKVIYWNREAEKISVKPRKTMLGKSLWDLFPGIRETPYYDLYLQLLEDPKPIQKEIFSPFTKRWLELHAYRTQKRISVFFRDITPRKVAEEELQKLSLIARQTNNPVIIQDRHRRVQWVNDAFIRISGYSFHECTGKLISEICDGPGTNPEAIQYAGEQASNHEPFRIEALNYKKNGDTYWSDISCQPIFDDSGNVVQFFSIATDITERKKLEKQLQKEQRERQVKIAAATLKAQERERSIVGQELHDNVNQVLTTVKLYAEMCRDGIGETKEIMDKSIQLLQNSISEIRGLSKRLSAPSLGKIKLADSIKELIAAVDLTKKVDVSLNTSSIESLQVEQEIHLAVYRILQEHLTNILKHAEAASVQVVIDLLAGHLHVHVQDDGKGFDTRKKSSGIGITNMVTRAESLKGTLKLSSSPGQGCELTVMLPLEV